MVVGVPTSKFLIIDVEIGGGFTHTRRQKPPKEKIPILWVYCFLEYYLVI